MTILNAAGLNATPTLIYNPWSAGGISQRLLGEYITRGILGTNSGALTAATYKEIVAHTGSGVVDFCAVQGVDATARTLGLKITMDGVDVFDEVSASEATAWYGMVGLGLLQYDAQTGNMMPVQTQKPYAKSLSISIKSSKTETDKIRLVCNWNPT